MKTIILLVLLFMPFVGRAEDFKMDKIKIVKITCNSGAPIALTIRYPDGSTREIKDVCEKDNCYNICLRHKGFVPSGTYENTKENVRDWNDCKQSCGEGK